MPNRSAQAMIVQGLYDFRREFEDFAHWERGMRRIKFLQVPVFDCLQYLLGLVTAVRALYNSPHF